MMTAEFNKLVLASIKRIAAEQRRQCDLCWADLNPATGQGHSDNCFISKMEAIIEKASQ